MASTSASLFPSIFFCCYWSIVYAYLPYLSNISSTSSSRPSEVEVIIGLTDDDDFLSMVMEGRRKKKPQAQK